MSPETLHNLLDFNIDRYLDPWIPHNRLYLLPKPISRWFGYRSEPHEEPPAILQWPITFLATVGGLCLVSGIYQYAPGIKEWHAPVLVASLGASAVLDFNTVRSPLAQPRNAIVGNVLAAICGVAISKLFQLNADFEHIAWVSGSVGCALASFVMAITGTVHPPGGATAIIASTDTVVKHMGWRYVPLVFIGRLIMLAVSLLFNNIFRQYPVYWWSANDVGRKLRQKQQEAKDAEKGQTSVKKLNEKSDTDSERTLYRTGSSQPDRLIVTPYNMSLPRSVQLSDQESALLAAIQNRLLALEIDR